jgi:RNA polymerase sigma-70 factor (ECF subfamily)
MNESTEQMNFDKIARELAQSIFHFFERYVRNRQTAEDLLQETLMRMNKGLPSFAGYSSIKTWAFSIARRVAADYLRHPDRQINLIQLDEAEELAGSDDEIHARLSAGEMSDCIRSVIDRLPEAYRSALILHDIEGLSAEQTAEISECSVATAKIRIHRARLQLKKALENKCDFYRGEDGVFRCDRKA